MKGGSRLACDPADFPILPERAGLDAAHSMDLHTIDGRPAE